MASALKLRESTIDPDDVPLVVKDHAFYRRTGAIWTDPVHVPEHKKKLIFFPEKDEQARNRELQAAEETKQQEKDELIAKNLWRQKVRAKLQTRIKSRVNLETQIGLRNKNTQTALGTVMLANQNLPMLPLESVERVSERQVAPGSLSERVATVARKLAAVEESTPREFITATRSGLLFDQTLNNPAALPAHKRELVFFEEKNRFALQSIDRRVESEYAAMIAAAEKRQRKQQRIRDRFATRRQVNAERELASNPMSYRAKSRSGSPDARPKSAGPVGSRSTHVPAPPAQPPRDSPRSPANRTARVGASALRKPAPPMQESDAMIATEQLVADVAKQVEFEDQKYAVEFATASDATDSNERRDEEKRPTSAGRTGAAAGRAGVTKLRLPNHHAAVAAERFAKLSQPRVTSIIPLSLLSHQHSDFRGLVLSSEEDRQRALQEANKRGLRATARALATAGSSKRIGVSALDANLPDEVKDETQDDAVVLDAVDAASILTAPLEIAAFENRLEALATRALPRRYAHGNAYGFRPHLVTEHQQRHPESGLGASATARAAVPGASKSHYSSNNGPDTARSNGSGISTAFLDEDLPTVPIE